MRGRILLALAALAVGACMVMRAGLYPMDVDIKALLAENDALGAREAQSASPARRRPPPREAMAAGAPAGAPAVPFPIPAGEGGEWGVADTYVMLDSWLKLPDSDTRRGEYRWNISTSSAGEYMLNIGTPFENVIEIDLSEFSMPFPAEPVITVNDYVPFPPPEVTMLDVSVAGKLGIAWSVTDLSIPYPYDPAIPADYLAAYPGGLGWPANPWAQTQGGLMTLQLLEAGEQSYRGFESSRYNWALDLEYPADRGLGRRLARATPRHARYIFTTPLRQLPSISIRMRGPDYPIDMSPDVLYRVRGDENVNLGGGFVYYYPGHGLEEGDRVLVRNASTGSARIDALLNRREGWLVSVRFSANWPPYNPSGAPAASPDYFVLVPSFVISSLPVTSPDYPTWPYFMDVYIVRRRLQIPLRIRQLLPKPTQKIVPV